MRYFLLNYSACAMDLCDKGLGFRCSSKVQRASDSRLGRQVGHNVIIAFKIRTFGNIVGKVDPRLPV